MGKVNSIYFEIMSLQGFILSTINILLIFQGDKLAVPVEISKYNPLKSDYQPIKDAGWEKGKRVPYMALARTLELVIRMKC